MDRFGEAGKVERKRFTWYWGMCHEVKLSTENVNVFSGFFGWLVTPFSVECEVVLFFFTTIIYF